MDYASFYRRSLTDRDAFWAEQAELIDWQQPFEQVCDGVVASPAGSQRPR